MTEQEIEFIDAETQYNNPQGTTFKEIVLGHLGKISTLCTKEFKEGYWEKKPVATSGGLYIAEVYREDTRDAYINAIDYLHDVLLPKFNKSQEVTTEIKRIEDELEKKKESIKNKNEWKDEKLISRRLIFRQLSLLLQKLDYLETGAIMA